MQRQVKIYYTQQVKEPKKAFQKTWPIVTAKYDNLSHFSLPNAQKFHVVIMEIHSPHDLAIFIFT